MPRVFGGLLVLALVSESLAAQTLSEQVRVTRDGTVRLSFAARPGVCGQGSGGIVIGHSSREWQPDCGARLVRVALRINDHRVKSVRTYVGGRWLPDDDAVDLGAVSAGEAAAFFVGLAEGSAGHQLTGDPLLPSVLADSVTVWPSLVRVARNTHVSRETRGRAVFWLGQAAGAAAGQALDSIALDDRGDREVRKQAIFALSQRSTDEGVPVLIRIARNNPDAELRRTALFWLGQSEDPRAVDLFEEILN